MGGGGGEGRKGGRERFNNGHYLPSISNDHGSDKEHY